jgi:hypothetical protein
MGGTSKLWFVYGGVALAVVLAVSRAFAQPWHWDFDQISLIFPLAAIILAIASWVFRWMRYGTEGVKQRWRTFDEGVNAELSDGPKFRRNIIFWLVVTILLVVAFTVTQHP